MIPIQNLLKKIILEIKIIVEAGEDPKVILEQVAKEHNLKIDDLWRFYLRR